jgi:hypothetical protein
MSDQWIEDPEISMSQSRSFLRKVKKVPYENINQDMEVIGEEILICARCREDKI